MTRVASLLLAVALLVWPAPYLTMDCQAAAGESAIAASSHAQMPAAGCCCDGMESLCEADLCATPQGQPATPTLASATVTATPAVHAESAAAPLLRLGVPRVSIPLPGTDGPPSAIPIPPFIAQHAFLI